MVWPQGGAFARIFGEQESGRTLARGSVLYDIGHDLVVDTRVAATCVGEHELAIEHLPAASPGARSSPFARTFTPRS